MSSVITDITVALVSGGVILACWFGTLRKVLSPPTRVVRSVWQGNISALLWGFGLGLFVETLVGVSSTKIQCIAVSIWLVAAAAASLARGARAQEIGMSPVETRLVIVSGYGALVFAAALLLWLGFSK